jgi:hypothetical protein
MGKKFNKNVCQKCGLPFTKEDPKTHFNQKYHRKCREELIKKQNLEGVRRYRKRYGNTIKGGRSEPLGTGNLGEHMLNDFKKEHQQIRKEMRRQGLR